MRKIIVSRVVPSNMPISWKTQQKIFQQTVFCQTLAPDRLWHMECGLSLKSLGFSHSTSPNGSCNYGSRCFSNDSFLSPVKGWMFLSRLWSTPQRNMCCRAFWKGGWRMQLITQKGSWFPRKSLGWRVREQCSKLGPISSSQASLVTSAGQVPLSLRAMVFSAVTLENWTKTSSWKLL